MSRRLPVVALAVGTAFGFFLTGSGLGDYDTIHDGLLLRDGYIYLMMLATVGTAASGIALLRWRGRTLAGEPLAIPRNPVRPESFYGGAVFGVGFGVGATCPGITVSAIATGAWLGGVVLAGILGGLWLRGRVEERQQALDAGAPTRSGRRPAPTPRPWRS